MNFVRRPVLLLSLILATWMLGACSILPWWEPDVPDQVQRPQGPGNSRWVPTDWSELPGFDDDKLHEAWNAWVRNCALPHPAFAPLCPDIRRLSLAGEAQKRAWIVDNLEPYRVESMQGSAQGLLTAYFEPELEGRRQPEPGFAVPVYRPPHGLERGEAWYSRREMDTNASARASLRGREILYLADPVQAMLLQTQGSGRVRITEPDGTRRLVRLAFAAHNGHPYRSIARWLLDEGEVRDASWAGIQAWAQRNPDQVDALMHRNPRVVFFREEPMDATAAAAGPKGSQGVALTPGRSVAIDPQSIPYGAPIWLVAPAAGLRRLVFAQDSGGAIRGAVRADYFAGWGSEAGEWAGRVRQNLQMWVLWPKAS
ncbi:murein transglycosylase A [Candidatus Symbiobacter mobilis]|uniref:peptidoglycan lytic exotransglycosylase n=1 Tax=Candidatus Symbiobacter mobilis CR TaxID=946483 RepID=U5NCQ4_9BURK|nr:MltA domain-containing protein [Candidatus Symbiobacter mobilis]AGX87939.1 membrane-bound lytic murein transglycosylase A [Candidatus Symbiobacter mobilis CR]